MPVGQQDTVRKKRLVAVFKTCENFSVFPDGKWHIQVIRPDTVFLVKCRDLKTFRIHTKQPFDRSCPDLVVLICYYTKNPVGGKPVVYIQGHKGLFLRSRVIKPRYTAGIGGHPDIPLVILGYTPHDISA